MEVGKKGRVAVWRRQTDLRDYLKEGEMLQLRRGERSRSHHWHPKIPPLDPHKKENPHDI